MSMKSWRQWRRYSPPFHKREENVMEPEDREHAKMLIVYDQQRRIAPDTYAVVAHCCTDNFILTAVSGTAKNCHRLIINKQYKHYREAHDV